MLGSDFAQTLVKEFGIEGESTETQARLVAQIGESVFARIVLEILTILPPDKHAGFDALIGTGDPDALHAYIAPHIPDFDLFVRETAQKEIEHIKADMNAA